jgi:long-chain acyl-CoA synthetase
VVGAQLAVPLEDECEGAEFLYSSGTTGRPKGVVSDVSLAPIGTPPAFLSGLQQLYGFDAETVYLSPAPLHHSAPLRAAMLLHRLGATTVVMDRFDAAWTLELVERYRVTHTQMVPTMFVRLLRLPAERRAQHDLSSLRCMIHAAAPCPPDVKAAMIDWLGPIVCEYYSATEMYAYTCIDSADWLAHRGSVGRALFGALHILDDSGRELPFGEPGTVWAESGPAFEYHNDPVKSAQARNERGWTTVGDIGYLDADGYLYLTDPKADMIIVGGVNVYPQEAENALIGHPAVEDVAVVGIPHPELGEEVKGVVQPRLGITPDAALEAELIDYCRQRLAYYKCPRSIDFVDELPRQPTGKLYRRLLRDRYSSAP